MRLPQEFIRLPLTFDVEVLRSEIAQLDESAWQTHPQGFPGNDALLLIARNGRDDDDSLDGPMLPTRHLASSPYLRQVMGSFGTVWGRSRLMRLAPHSTVPPHADVALYWFRRVRIHIPIVTDPRIEVTCGTQRAHFGTGEAWMFDTWQTHTVSNPTHVQRVHLVADTVGTSRFWSHVQKARSTKVSVQHIPFNPQLDTALHTERHDAGSLLPPAEVEAVVADLLSSVASSETRKKRYVAALRTIMGRYCQDWRALWSMHGGANGDGAVRFQQINTRLLKDLAPLAHKAVIECNGVDPVSIIKARLLKPNLGATSPESPRHPSAARPAGLRDVRARRNTKTHRSPTSVRFERPVFIVCAPRTGSTMLFELLAHCPALPNIGGESHRIFESIQALTPAARNFDSNRLDEQDATDDIAQEVKRRFTLGLLQRNAIAPNDGIVRLLDKLPKNALRVPFLNRVFPDARFIVLHRDPAANISSIISAWRSGKFVTYPTLPEWSDLPWSLLLVPGWRQLSGKSLPEIAAAQWKITNEILLQDMATVPPDRWGCLSYERLLADPAASVQDLCAFMQVPCSEQLLRVAQQPLPPSRHTLTQPDRNKWQQHASELDTVLPTVSKVAQALRNAPPIPSVSLAEKNAASGN